jgi:pSer/pThr/pTyr-binding forkhead associated (FHA) protein
VKSLVTGAGRSSTTVEVQQPAPPPRTATDHSTTERATLRYEDEQGPHVFAMRKDTLSVGRGGSAVWVDVQVVTTTKVSREHFRLRRDATGVFFIQDLSAWGTSVDGAPLPPAIPGQDGVLQPGAERPLSSPARIELADALVVHFEANQGLKTEVRGQA